MDNKFIVKRLDIYSYRPEIPKPVVTSFGSISSRGTVLIYIEDADGAFGWGEIWSNFPTITTEYRAQLAASVLPSLLIDSEIREPKKFINALKKQLHVLCVQSGEFGPIDSIIAATNQALWGLRARKENLPLKKLLNKKASDTVPAYGSGLNPSDCIEITERARNEGYRAFKLKIGFGTDIDKTNLEMMRSGMQTGERLFVDADQRWGLQGAKDQIMTLVDNGVEWFEEPMVATETQNNWGKLCGSCSISLAGGENLMSASKLLSALDWFDFIQPDIGKWGGVDGCMAIASKVVESGKKYCPHWLSGGVGLLNSAHILAAVGGDGLLEVDTNPNPLCSLMLESIPGVKKELYLLENKSGIGISSPQKAVQGYLQSHQSFH